MADAYQEMALNTLMDETPARMTRDGHIDACQMIKDKHIMAYKPGFAPHLQVVLALWAGQYVTWIYSVSDCGFHHGHYHGSNLSAALGDFDAR